MDNIELLFQTVNNNNQTQQSFVQQMMNKCEHGDRIALFCATDCCASKELGGCELCIKKYHNHIGQTLFVKEEEVQNLVKKYQLDHTIKPKCRVLQEAIYNYFSLIKNEINNTIDLICKNIVNQIGYPFLFTNNALSTYKRLKNKEYKKLTQKEFKSFYQLSIKVNEKDLIKEEARIYLSQIRETCNLLNSLESIMNQYEKLAKSSNHDFEHDTSCMAKINEIAKSLSSDSPPRNKNMSKEKETKESNYFSLQTKQTSSELMKNQVKNENRAEMKLSVKLDLIRNYEKQKELQTNLKHPINNTKQGSLQKRTMVEKLSSARDRTTTQNKPAIQNNGKIENLKQELNMKELQINEKKRQLLDMMKQKEESPKLKESQKERRKSSLYKQTTPNTKEKEWSANQKRDSLQKHSSISNIKLPQDDVVEAEDWKKIEDNKNTGFVAFTKLPLDENQRKSEEKEELYKKIAQPIKQNLIKSPLDIDSPYLVKKIGTPSRDYKSKPEQKKIESVLQSKIATELKQSQQKSVALFYKSLTLKPEEAITYLECALKYAQNNLSAGEYLSFLYLQLNRPRECLQLCNKMLQKFEGHAEYAQQNFHLNNNKALALNILGRYSQSIVILQACLKIKQREKMFKNLADSYFSISIYDKAIANYQKTIRMNQNNEQAHYNLSVCLYVQGSYHNARSSVLQAMRLHPKVEAYQQLLSNIESKLTHK